MLHYIIVAHGQDKVQISLHKSVVASRMSKSARVYCCNWSLWLIILLLNGAAYSNWVCTAVLIGLVFIKMLKHVSFALFCFRSKKVCFFVLFVCCFTLLVDKSVYIHIDVFLFLFVLHYLPYPLRGGSIETRPPLLTKYIRSRRVSRPLFFLGFSTSTFCSFCEASPPLHVFPFYWFVFSGPFSPPLSMFPVYYGLWPFFGYDLFLEGHSPYIYIYF